MWLDRLRAWLTPARVVFLSLLLLALLLVAALWATTAYAVANYALADEFVADTRSQYDINAASMPASCKAAGLGAFQQGPFTVDWYDGYLQVDDAAGQQYILVGIPLDATMIVESLRFQGGRTGGRIRMGWQLCDASGDLIDYDNGFWDNNDPDWYEWGPLDGDGPWSDVGYVAFYVNAENHDAWLGNFYVSGSAASDPFASYTDNTIAEEDWATDVLSNYDFAPDIPDLCWDNSTYWGDYETLWVLDTNQTHNAAEGSVWSGQSGTGNHWLVFSMPLGAAYDVKAIGLGIGGGGTGPRVIRAKVLGCDGSGYFTGDGEHEEQSPNLTDGLPFDDPATFPLGGWPDTEAVYVAIQTAATVKLHTVFVEGELSNPSTATPTPTASATPTATSLFGFTPTPPATTPTPYVPATPYPTATWPANWPTLDPNQAQGTPIIVVPILPTDAPTSTPDIPDYAQPGYSSSGPGLEFGEAGNGAAHVAMVPYDFGCPIQIPDSDLGPGTSICISYIQMKDVELLGMTVPLSDVASGLLALLVVGWVIRR